MKSRLKDAYVELPLKAFITSYPQYRSCVLNGLTNVNDPNCIVRMQIKNGRALVECGYPSDEWTIGGKGKDKENTFSHCPDPKLYQTMKPEAKAKYIATMRELVEAKQKEEPNAYVMFDEETGAVTYRPTDN